MKSIENPPILKLLKQSHGGNGRMKNGKEEENGMPAGEKVTLFPYDYSKGDLKINIFTDMAIVERVQQRFKDSIVRSGEKGQAFYVFDSKEKIWRAQKVPSEMISEFVHVCAKDTLAEPTLLTRCKGSDGEVSVNKFLKMQEKYLSESLNSAITKLVQISNKFPRLTAKDFDKNPELILCKNGVLDLKNLVLRDPTAQDRLMLRTPINWEPESSYEEWEGFLLEVFQDNSDPIAMVSFMQELFGYTITGSIDAQMLFIHYGGGSNGKSKVLDALEALGGSYSTRINCSALSKSKNAVEKEFNRLAAKLEAKRIGIIDDLDVKAQWNEGVVKSLTSRTLPTRFLWNEECDVPNRVKFHIGCNDVPRPEAENFGILRRICIIPYLRQFRPSAEKEREIMNLIDTSLPGILRWAVEGYQSLLSHGGNLNIPQEAQESIEEYRVEHFVIDSVLDGIFEPPKENSEWYPLSDLVKTANERLPEGHKVNAVVLGRYLAGTKKYPQKTISRQKVRCYQLEISNETSKLL